MSVGPLSCSPHLQRLDVPVALTDLLHSLTELRAMFSKLVSQLPIATALFIQFLACLGQSQLELRALGRQLGSHRCLAPPELLQALSSAGAPGMQGLAEAAWAAKGAHAAPAEPIASPSTACASRGGAGGWRGLQPAKTRVTFSWGPDVMAGAGTWHHPARMSHWEGAHATLRSCPVGVLAFFS